VNSKERVKMTMAHEEADRIPINFRATDQIVQRLSKSFCSDYFGILNYYRVDFREVIPPYVGPLYEKGEDGSEIDMWGVGRKELVTDSGRDVMISVNPLKDAQTPEEVKNHSWPKAEWFDFSQVKQLCRDFREYAISTPGLHIEGYHGVFHILTYLFGMERAMLDLVVNPEPLKVAIQEIMRFFKSYYERLFEAGGGNIDFLFYKDDFGAQNNLLISKEMFREFFFPNIKELSDLAAGHGAKVILHSCGSIMKLIPDFIESGAAVLDPIQVTAKDMDIKELKSKFGEALVFHGGIDVQRLMPFGSVEEIKEKARETIEVLGKGGGYFSAPHTGFSPTLQLKTSKLSMRPFLNAAFTVKFIEMLAF
jgi:uroporphyrinogen decarboxylase